MDVAYDRITEESLPDVTSSHHAAGSEESSDGGQPPPPQQQSTNLPTEFQQAFQAVSASPWGTKLGGWFSQARKQGESFYQDLQKEASEASEQATKGFENLREQVVSRTRGMTLNASSTAGATGEGEEDEEDEAAATAQDGVPRIETTTAEKTEAEASERKAELLSSDLVKEAGNFVAAFRSTAAARLKDLQAAEDAADEALLKFGMNVRNFLRDAVTITAPDDEEGKREVMFETQEPGTGRKVFHSTRLDAQLHAIHSETKSFTEDPNQGEEWKTWEQDFDVDKKTEAIAANLEKYEELRRAMEQLVPEKVEYQVFWKRYYFLRTAVEEEERRRREVLKGATGEKEEDIGWDDDEDDGEEEDKASTPQPQAVASASTTTLNAPTASGAKDADLLKPAESRRSEDENKSVAGSDASYDLVSGATSRALGSPKEKAKDEDSDDDWE